MRDSPVVPFEVVIVEDEERARRTLRGIIEQDPELVVVAETSGSEAPAVIERCRPLILLLDVQMSGMDGFDVLRALGKSAPPVLIFVTAFDEYALNAFEVAALDYVLKPFTDDRLLTALTRAKTRIRAAATHDPDAAVQRLLRHLDALPRSAGPPRLVVRDGGRTILVEPESIDWVQAQGVYARLHTRSGPLLVRESLADLERRLEEHGFIRIHRSALVNIGRIQEISHQSHGDCAVRLRDGTELTLSRTRRAALEDRLQKLM